MDASEIKARLMAANVRRQGQSVNRPNKYWAADTQMYLRDAIVETIRRAPETTISVFDLGMLVRYLVRMMRGDRISWYAFTKMMCAVDLPCCVCGRKGRYRVGVQGYCSGHRHLGHERLERGAASRTPFYDQRSREVGVANRVAVAREKLRQHVKARRRR